MYWAQHNTHAICYPSSCTFNGVHFRSYIFNVVSQWRTTCHFGGTSLTHSCQFLFSHARDTRISLQLLFCRCQYNILRPQISTKWYEYNSYLNFEIMRRMLTILYVFAFLWSYLVHFSTYMYLSHWFPWTSMRTKGMFYTRGACIEKLLSRICFL